MLNANKILLVFCLSCFCIVAGYAQIIDIPDPNFKDALVNQAVVDTDGDGIFDADADTNEDGEIDIQEALAVEVLGLVGKQISSLEGLQEFVNLVEIYVGYNSLQQIEVSTLTQLEVLVCSFNQIKQLDVTTNPDLVRLELDFNQISDLDLSQNIQLERLWFTFNDISNIDLSAQSSLLNLNADSNEIQEINLSNNPLLVSLAIDNNLLSAIDLSGNPELEFVDVYGNQLTALDLSNQNNLTLLTCLNNDLNQLNIQNGNNEQMTFLNTTNNPNLLCIQVDDQAYAEAQSDWLVDSGVAFSEDCGFLGIEDSTFSSWSIIPNPSDGLVRVQYALELSEPLSWQLFDASGRIVQQFEGLPTQIDLSSYPAGIYFVKATDALGRLSHQKLVKR